MRTASTSDAGLYVFEPLSGSLVIGPGKYVLGAQYKPGSADAYRTNVVKEKTGADVEFLGARRVGSPTMTGFEFPDVFEENVNSFFGPNLLLRALAIVPEPPSAVLAVSFIGLCALRRWMTRQQRPTNQSV